MVKRRDLLLGAGGTLAGVAIAQGQWRGITQSSQPGLPSNPHIKFFESRLRGYVRCTVTGDRWLSELRAVDTVKQQQSSIYTLASFAVEAGKPGAQKG